MARSNKGGKTRGRTSSSRRAPQRSVSNIGRQTGRNSVPF